eukprot:m.231342 g.231342  ORF g.231342 m.231342 type:complete len:334 (+) comp33599_c7_seq2:134-1135(+)
MSKRRKMADHHEADLNSNSENVQESDSAPTTPPDTTTDSQIPDANSSSDTNVLSANELLEQPVPEEEQPKPTEEPDDDTKPKQVPENTEEPEQHWPAAPECAVCISFLCDPLTLGCGHSFCRVCLLQATFLAPDGRSCPLCRKHIDLVSPADHPADADIEATVLAVVPQAIYNEKLATRKIELAELLENASSMLPVFFMQPGTEVGAPVALHLFEPRYKILIRRAWEGNKRFIYCAEPPRPGCPGVLVQVATARFLPDGRANIFGIGAQQVELGDTWVEEHTGGLYYSRVDVLNRNDPVADAISAYHESEDGDDDTRDHAAAVMRGQRDCTVM